MDVSSFESPFQMMASYIKKMDVKNNLLSLDNENIQRSIINLDYKIMETEEDEENHMGRLGLFVGVGAENKETNAALSIFLDLQGAFCCPKNSLTKDEFIGMLEVNGTACLYSIARANITNISSQCVLEGQLRLPMLNVVAYVNARRQASLEEDTSTDE